MDILSLLFSLLPLVLFGLALFALTEVYRRIIQYAAPKFSQGKLFLDLILPSLPTLLGMLIAALAPTLPVPEGFSSTMGRIILGATAGLLSSHVYRFVKASLKSRLNQLLPRESHDDCRHEVGRCELEGGNDA